MDGAIAAGPGGFGAPCSVAAIRPEISHGGGGILGRCGDGYVLRPLSFHTDRDTGPAGRVVDRDRTLFFPDRVARRTALAPGMLGIRRGSGAQRPDQRAYRGRVSLRDHRVLPAANGESAALAQNADRIEHDCFPGDRGALACSGCFAQSAGRGSQGLSLVLFCERAFPAIHRETLPDGLRQSSPSVVLGAAPGMAIAVERIPAPGVAADPAAV